MGIRKLKPTTPGQRHKVIGAFDKITASTPEKSLVTGKKVLVVVTIPVR
jgi:large subunit ribosomal protein L2